MCVCVWGGGGSAENWMDIMDGLHILAILYPFQNISVISGTCDNERLWAIEPS